MSRKSAVNERRTFRINRIAQAARLLSMLAGMTSPGLTMAQLSFPQLPPMSASVGGVLPNVIVAVDGTGSMTATDAACQKGSVKDGYGTTYNLACTGTAESRINALSDALLTVFSDPALLGNIRLAFEATSVDAGFGPNRFNPSTHDNSMKVFTKEYQADFMKWANELKSKWFTCNPTEGMIAYAGEYLKGQWVSANATYYTCELGANNYPQYRTTGAYTAVAGTGSPTPSLYLKFNSIPDADNPWNGNANLRTKLATKDASDASAQANSDRLSCRRSYLIFMTDGGVNGNQFAPIGTNNNNYGGSTRQLPDGTTYDPTKYYGKVYSDYSPNNYADHTLYYWSTDLTGKGKGAVRPMMSVTTNETFSYKYGTNTYTQAYEPYWNPKNDPATWQHMQTYTLGFGANSGAGNLTSGAYAHPSGSSASPKINLPIGFDGYDPAGNVLNYGNFFQMFATGALMNGGISWPWVSDCDGCNAYYGAGIEVTLDVYHAALAGRGKYYPATSVNALSAAFKDILSTTITQTAPGGIASASASSSRLTGDTVAYVAGYAYDESQAVYNAANRGWGSITSGSITGTINGWSGSLKATKTITDGSSNASSVNGPTLWEAKIPATRNVFTANANGTGIALAWAGLNGDPSVTASGLTQADVNAVLNNPLGDIVNSQLVYVGQPALSNLDPNYYTFIKTVNAFNGSKTYRNGVVYAGANDGMLHGFDAGQGKSDQPGDGHEVMAYVPRGLLPALHGNTFANADYAHRFWVDGSPFSGDAQLSAPSAGTDSTSNPGNWGTVLVGTLGAGGPGYFVLDVTNPSLFSAANANKLVLLDATDPSQIDPAALPYIGHQFSPPVMEMYSNNQSAQIMQINTNQTITINGKPQPVEWAVIMGNGYNSASGLPVLLVQSLTQKDASGRLRLYTVPATCTAANINDCKNAGNGLSAPRPIDVDGNGTADIVYAGDLMGNLWKFDISNPDHAQWKVANSAKNAPAPLFTAVGPTGKAQPITTAPAVAPNNAKGGFMVVFGTGKNLTKDDTTDTSLNSVYGLYDDEKIASTLLTLTGPGLKATVGQVLLGNSQSNQTVPFPSPISATCLSGTGTNRYSGCLSMHNGGAISTGKTQKTSKGVTVTSNRSISVDVGNQKAGGWYYDIPDIVNGNAAKVLDNPIVQSYNRLMFLSRNVASTTSSGSIATLGSSTESCGATALSNAVATRNYLNLLTGNPPDNPSDPPNDPPLDNRFKVEGTTQFILSSTDSVVCVGSIDCPNPPPEQRIPPSARVGWRIGR